MKILVPALVLSVIAVLLYFYTVSYKIVLQGYSDLKTFRDFSYTPGGIPKIIIKTSHYKRSEIPREI